MNRCGIRTIQGYGSFMLPAVLLVIGLCLVTFPGASQCAAQEQYCGPDLTDWLLEEMNDNAASDYVAALYAARKSRSARAALLRMRLFAWLVGPGRQWDHKGPILDLLDEGLLEGGCPTDDCPLTITLCGGCYDFDVFSNIHYGYIGRVAGFTSAVLLTAPVLVQSGGTPRDKIVLEAKDTPAVLAGQDVYLQVRLRQLLDPSADPWPGRVTRAMLCSAVWRRSSRLAAGYVEPGCRPCDEPPLP